MAEIDHFSKLMLCVLEVYSLPTNYSEKYGDSSPCIIVYQWLNCSDQAASAAWNKEWMCPPRCCCGQAFYSQ